MPGGNVENAHRLPRRLQAGNGLTQEFFHMQLALADRRASRWS